MDDGGKISIHKYLSRRIDNINQEKDSIEEKVNDIVEVVYEIRADVRSLTESHERHLIDFGRVEEKTFKLEQNWQKYKVIFGIFSIIVTVASVAAILGLPIETII